MTSSTPDFNPYHAWLGLDRSITQPSYFQLLGISPQERNDTQIAAAAQQATTRVRGFRPGSRSAEWARVLDEINTARICLTDPVKRAIYERQQAVSGGSAPRTFSRPAPRGARPIAPVSGGVSGTQPRAVPMSAPQKPSTSQPIRVPMGPTVTGRGQVPTGIPVGSTVPSGSPSAAVPTGVSTIRSKPTSVTASLRGRRSVMTPVLIAAAGCLILLVAVLILVVAIKKASTKKTGPAPSPIAENRQPIDRTRRGGQPPQEQSATTQQTPVASDFRSGDEESSRKSQPNTQTGPDQGVVVPVPDEDDEPLTMPTFPKLELDLPPGNVAPADVPPGTEAAAPTFQPEPQDVAALSAALKTARAAVLDGKYDAAIDQMAKLVSVSKTREHQALCDRLDLLAQYAKNFKSALGQAMAALEAGDEIEVGTSTVVGVVEASADRITIRVQGANQTWAIDDLPPGLAVSIVDKWLQKGDPVGLVMKSAYLVARKDAKETELAKARQWWQEAASAGFDIGDLPKVIDDSYDLQAGPNQ